MSKDTLQTYTLPQTHALYHQPLLDLIYQAATVHRAHHDHHEIQLCTLISIKTGGCPEDCGYCSQSMHHKTGLKNEPLMDVESVMDAAKRAHDSGSTRFCMGAAWREVKDSRSFDRVLDMVRGVSALGLEVCCTLGMLNGEQAKRLKEAGLTAYNHNLDTSEDHYGKIISTRTYQDRLDTLAHVAEAGISACCGGIIGSGETPEDRIKLLHRLHTLTPQPESVPINMLVAIKGTPLEHQTPPDVSEWIRCIAVARILMPKAMVRLSAGRLSISREAQTLAFMAGANAIFTGDKLLTTPNSDFDEDKALLADLGLKPRPPYKSPVAA